MLSPPPFSRGHPLWRVTWMGRACVCASACVCACACAHSHLPISQLVRWWRWRGFDDTDMLRAYTGVVADLYAVVVEPGALKFGTQRRVSSSPNGWAGQKWSSPDLDETLGELVHCLVINPFCPLNWKSENCRWIQVFLTMMDITTSLLHSCAQFLGRFDIFYS